MDTRALAGTKIYIDHLYEFNVLSFGIGNSSQAFQRFIDEVLRGYRIHIFSRLKISNKNILKYILEI